MESLKLLPCLNLGVRSDIVRLSVSSRLIVLVLQFVSNILIPDHEAGVFLYPKSNQTVSSLLDHAAQSLLGGFVRWDGQYFMHIVKHGYTYENVLAFFPLYPITVRVFSNILTPVLPLLNEDSIILITFLLFNMFVFVSTALVLYDLSAEVLNKNLAYKSVVLFCFNPASIFFSAPYSEGLFAYLSFKALWSLHMSKKANKYVNYRNVVMSVFYISLSICTRSNGLLNIGFLLFYYVKYTHRHVFLPRQIAKFELVKHLVLLLYFSGLCLVPFILLQSYNYFLFCKDFELDLPDFLVSYAASNDYVLPGSFSKHNQTWCSKPIPLSYSYVQSHYWHVGFLQYFQLKQIPNFLLAAPLLMLILGNCRTYFREYRTHCLNLGLFNYWRESNLKQGRFTKDMFVYVAHGGFLTLFCLFCIHVQVATRIVCSASPLLYWFCAYYFENCDNKSFLFHGTLGGPQKLIRLYFLGYFTAGTIMFCNFLPWT